MFSTRLRSDLPARIAKATLPLGLPEASFPALLGASFAGNFSGLDQLPGVGATIIQAAMNARKDSFAYSFRCAIRIHSSFMLFWAVCSLLQTDSLARDRARRSRNRTGFLHKRHFENDEQQAQR